MITPEIFKDLTPEDHCVSMAYTVSSLAIVGQLALENDTSGVSDVQVKASVAVLCEVIHSMMAVVIDGAEGFERELKRGVWAPKEASHEAA